MDVCDYNRGKHDICTFLEFYRNRGARATNGNKYVNLGVYIFVRKLSLKVNKRAFDASFKIIILKIISLSTN